MNVFSYLHRFKSMEGQVLKVDMKLNNSGAGMGPILQQKYHFEGPINRWSGLAVGLLCGSVQGSSGLRCPSLHKLFGGIFPNKNHNLTTARLCYILGVSGYVLWFIPHSQFSVAVFRSTPSHPSFIIRCAFFRLTRDTSRTHNVPRSAFRIKCTVA